MVFLLASHKDITSVPCAVSAVGLIQLIDVKWSTPIPRTCNSNMNHFVEFTQFHLQVDDVDEMVMSTLPLTLKYVCAEIASVPDLIDSFSRLPQVDVEDGAVVRAWFVMMFDWNAG
jgi:hypothetical protein